MSAELEPVQRELARFDSKQLLWPSFEPDLETRYQQEMDSQRLKLLSIQAMVCLFIYDLFLGADWVMDPERFKLALIVRLFVVTPIVLFLYVLWCRPALRAYRGLILAVASVVCYAGLLGVYWNAASTTVLELELGLLLIPLTVNTVLRIGMPQAVASSAVCYALHLIFLWADPNIAVKTRWTVAGMAAWSTVLTLMANYALGREQRHGYLLQLRGRIQESLLTQANEELKSLSTTDRLTGLSNRRAYDAKLIRMWEHAVKRREPLAAVMVDVDRFKQLNDTHGHPYGDKILQRVGSLLQQALRGERDFVARYGGEEFVVLLPNADRDAAFTVAERIRLLVQVAGSPALQREAGGHPQSQWATVSCGVATAFPAEGGDPAALIAAADKALYRAKQEGRNRVCSA